MAGRQGEPSAFSTYASRFLAGGVKGREVEHNQIFRAPSPSDSSHDPFALSPSSSSHPRLPGSSRSPSPSPPPSLMRGQGDTPPIPGGARIEDIPDIGDDDDDQGLDTGLLFGGSSRNMPRANLSNGGAIPNSGNRNSAPTARRGKVPNPYEASSESEDEIEADLDHVAAHRSLAGMSVGGRGGAKPGASVRYPQSLAQGVPNEAMGNGQYPTSPPFPSDRATGSSLRLARPVSDRARKGWLAHQSVFPPSSSSESETDESDKATEADSEEEEERRTLQRDMRREAQSRMMGQSRAQTQGMGKGRDESKSGGASGGQVQVEGVGYMLSPSELYEDSMRPEHSGVGGGGQGEMGYSLDQPLLEPDELERRQGGGKVPTKLHVYHGRFGHWEREGLRKYKDTGVLALWLSTLIAVMFGLLFVWGATDPPPEAPSHRQAPSLIPLLPLLLVLLIPPLVVPPAFLFLLQHTVRPVLTATAVSIPLSLFLCGWWALGASFETSGWDGIDSGERWWGTSGLRILAVLLWALAAFFGRLVWIRRKRLERTVKVVELSTHLLLSHPPLLLLTPLLLAVFALASIPFLTLLVRLAMIGYWRHPRENTYIYQIAPRAGWLIALVTSVWVWTWGVIRGVGRVAVAGVIGEWYFHRNDPHHPPPLEITQAALHRATGTSLGSICIGAGIVAIARLTAKAASELRRLTSPKNKLIPPWLMFVTRLTPFFAIAAGVLDQLNGYALVYVGITGEAFWPSARRAVGLAGRRKGGHLLDYTLIKLLLTLASTAMGLFTGTAGYLYMAHSLSNPAYAPIAGVLCGGVPFLAVRAGASVLGDAADALFICYQIDRELGGQHSEEAKEAQGQIERRTPVGAMSARRADEQFSAEKRNVGAAAV